MKLVLELFNAIQTLIGFTTREYDKELKPIYIKAKNTTQRNFRK